jgi:hypothetical protein
VADPPPREPSPPRGSEPYGSIIERFRGTEWASGPEPTPPARSPLSHVLVLVGVVVLLVAGTAVIVLLPPPAASPVPSRIVYTPPPTPGPGDLVEAAFWSYVRQPSLNYHEAIDVALTVDAYQLTESLSLDVFADDISGTVDFEVKGKVKPIHLILLRTGGAMYARLRSSDPWIDANTLGQPAIRPRPFLSLEDARQLRYAGTVEREEGALHRLVSTDLYRPPVTRVFPTAYVTAPTSQITLELLVTATGEPVEARLTLHIPADPANAVSAVDGTATYEFAKQGEVQPIPPPKL